MNVTGIEWRDLDAHEGRFFSGHGPRRKRKPRGADEEDIVEIHGATEEEPADGLDLLEAPSPLTSWGG